MKQRQRDWLNKGIAALLVAGALGVIAWQGVLYLKEDTQTEQPMRIQVIQTTGGSEITLMGTETAQATVIDAMSVTSYTVASSTSTSAKGKNTQAKAAAVDSTASEATSQDVTFPLELNAASVSELQALPGIGEVLAERIVLYREQLGGFQNREQLLEVDGIGEATFGEIYDLLYLTVETYDSETESESVEEPAPAVEVPPVQEPEPQPAATEVTPTESVPTITTAPIEAPEFPLDLNTATKEELLFVPEMTEELAEEILAFREENQYYSSVYELLYLEHMTSTYFTQIREYVEAESENS